MRIQRFSPAFKNADMRSRLSEGEPDRPLLLYVGRLGKEKKLIRLKKLLEANPTWRLALVGSGPHAEQLKEDFKGWPVYFPGQLVGK
jgi:glycosyltransferase involved in cell wall biosynthesis